MRNVTNSDPFVISIVRSLQGKKKSFRLERFALMSLFTSARVPCPTTIQRREFSKKEIIDNLDIDVIKVSAAYVRASYYHHRRVENHSTALLSNNNQ